MPYKIEFFGDRPAEILSDEAGQALYEDYRSGELPEKVEIKGRFIVPKAKIAGVERFVEKREEYEMSRSELLQFEHDKLGPYLSDGQLTFAAELRFLEAQGVIRVEWHVTEPKTQSEVDVFVQPHLLNEYIRLGEKISQWKNQRARRDYAQKMEAKELDAVVSSMNINK